MSTSRPAKSTGYLNSFAVTYQVEGVTAAEAKRIQAAVERALRTNVPELISSAAEVGGDRRVLAIRVEARESAPEEYDA